MADPKKAAPAPFSWFPRLGPGLIVAAAFVGPGTVITATRAGANHGLGLVWVVVFSVLGTIVLQEMASRLGTLSGIGLGELLRRQFKSRAASISLAVLVTAAIGFGNAAYQTGNLVGAAVGVADIVNLPVSTLVLVIGVVAAALLFVGSYKFLERVLVGAVSIMGCAFVAAAIHASLQQKGASSSMVPSLPLDDWRIVLAMVGTTIVPYNLFLHASAASQRWGSVRPRAEGLRMARWDSAIGVSIGGIMTLAIMAAAAVTFNGRPPGSVVEMAESLEAILGNTGARVAFLFGLTAAGVTSAITAPLAAAHAVTGVFGWDGDRKSWAFRAVWMTVLGLGMAAAYFYNRSPSETIVFAQAANTLVLPIIAIMLLMACNAKILGKYANKTWHNVVAVIVIATVIVMSVLKWF